MKLICFLSYGYPSIPRSIEIARQYVEAGCDVLEIDLPSAAPYLEGEYIAGRMKAALASCGDYEEYMAGIVEIKRDNPNAEIILLCYENTLLNLPSISSLRPITVPMRTATSIPHWYISSMAMAAEGAPMPVEDTVTFRPW